ncbi:MAG TPA: hypothetical protein VJ063_16680 [Verrucomicrobiae bacterium]|nr:hypothetical protein [Verrucomicrobiae bacterium]
MNNLTFFSLALVSAGAFWLSQRNAIEAARANQRVLHQELAIARQTLDENGASITHTGETLALHRQELDLARNESAAAVAIQFVTPVPPDPAREGFWPADKPYCYLSKQHLATIGFNPFSDNAALTSEAATLFGMSGVERAAVDAAYGQLLERTHELHVSNAQLVETNAAANTENHREITYRIPALTNEFRELRGTFASSLEQTLGDSRANVFLNRADSQLDSVFGQFGNDGFTIRYYADRKSAGIVEHLVELKRLDGYASYGYRIRFPIDASSPLRKYRHLIGDQPLLAVQNIGSN